MKLDNNNHSVFLLYYHLVLVVKYRRKVFSDQMSQYAKDIFVRIGSSYNITLEEWNHDQDHVHIMFRAHPNTEMSKFINAYKSMLEYKLAWQGKQLIKIDKWYPSSQLCHVCGYQNNDTKDLSVREWDCPKCGSHHNRDKNAAINIREEARRISA